MVEIELVQEVMETENVSLFQSKLIQLLKNNGPLTRDQICEALGFEQYDYIHLEKLTHTGEKIIPYRPRKTKQYNRRTTVFENLEKLIKRKIVEKFSKNNGKRGRPPVLFRIKS
ncbi:MAG: hypothetical protein EU531_10925 [Promethearchaeota archaeon]|nr:MAG: hypothetical protein EU531_10925 [Candidatus Lokiarchaeota archaeon]